MDACYLGTIHKLYQTYCEGSGPPLPPLSAIVSNWLNPPSPPVSGCQHMSDPPFPPWSAKSAFSALTPQLSVPNLSALGHTPFVKSCQLSGKKCVNICMFYYKQNVTSLFVPIDSDTGLLLAYQTYPPTLSVINVFE